jgi:phage-related protein
VIAVVGVLATLVTGVLAVKAATLVWNAAQIAAKAATVAWTTVQWLLNAALTANPIGLVVLAVGALVAAFVLAYTKSETFRKVVTGAFDAIKGAAAAVLGWLKGNWPALLAILTGPIGVAAYVISKHWDQIKATVSSAVTLVKGWITDAWERIRQATLGAWGTVAAKVTGAVADIKQALSAFAGWITAFATGAWTLAIGKLAAVWGVIEHAARTAVSGVKDALNGMIDWIAGIVDRVKAVAADVANAIKRPINSVIRAWNGLQIPRLEVKLPKRKIFGKTVGGGSFGFGPVEFPDIPQLAAGGVVSSPTLALIGEQGSEIVAPERMLRDLIGDRHVEVHVYIGDTELRGLVRTEITEADTGLARTLLAGAR